MTGFLYGVGLLGLLGGYQTNAVQFGLDQLVDASSDDISSYISWYVWMFYLSKAVVILSQMCICKEYTAVSSLLLPIVLTLSLSSNIFLNHWLIKEKTSF